MDRSADPSGDSLLAPQDACPDHVEDVLLRLDRLTTDRDTVAFGRIVSELGGRSHAPLLLVLSILLVLPIGMLPGVGGAVGAVIAVIGLQVMRGDAGLWLPDFISNRKVPATALHKTVERVKPIACWLGARLSPQLPILAASRVSLTAIATILLVLGLSMLVLGVIPVFAPLIGLPILLFAIGLVSRDGRAVLAGYLLCLPPVAAAILLIADG